MALAQPAEARIVYTPTNQRIVNGAPLDLNNDGRNDFVFYTSAGESTNTLRISPRHAKNLIWGTGRYASALNRAVTIDSNKKLQANHTSMCLLSVLKSRGPWRNVQNRYLGLKFYLKGEAHYGWARLSTEGCSATLTGYAYETVAGKAIKTGKTKGPDVHRAACDSRSAGPRSTWDAGWAVGISGRYSLRRL